MSETVKEADSNPLCHIHQQQLAEGKDNASNTLPIITILGGIDKVLSDYLSQSVIDGLALTQDQCTQIINITSTKSELRSHQRTKTFTRHKTKTILTNTTNTNTSRNYNEEDFCYSFYKNDTLLHKSSFYIKNKNVVDKLIVFYESKLYLSSIVVTLLMYNIIGNFTRYNFGTAQHIAYSLSFSVFIWTPYCLYKLLTINRIALRLIGAGFEFWFKIFVSVCHFIAIWIDYYVLQYDRWPYPKLAIVERVLFGTAFILMIAVISLFDGIRIHRIGKTIIVSLVAIFASYYVIATTIKSSDGSGESQESKYGLIQIGAHFAVPIVSLEISTMLILNIFLYRQACLAYSRKEENGKIQGIVLYKTPYIIWNVDHGHDTNLNGKKQADQLQHNNDRKTDVSKINSESFIVSKQTLKLLHEQQLKRGINNDRYARVLVDILGGIDKILADYLNMNDKIELNDSDLMEIHEIIRPKLRKRTLTLTSIDQKKDDMDLNIYYFFDEKDTFLHYLTSKQTADTIIKLFWSKTAKILLVLTIFVYVIILIMDETATDDKTAILYQIIWIIIGFIIFVPYAVLFMLTCNKQAFIFAVTSFDFWLQTGYGMSYVISSAIDDLYLNPQIYTDFGISIQLAIVQYISFAIWMILAIMCIAALDSIKMDKNWKIILLSACTIFGFVWTCFLQFVATADEQRRDGSVLFITDDFSISMLALEISGVRIVTIFFGQQLFWTILQKNQAVLILYIPHIRWYESDKKIERNNVGLHLEIAMERVVTDEVSDNILDGDQL